jgi:predicted GNAT family N-acyltransferase
MHTIITDYTSREAEIRLIRDQVFIIEQRVPRDEEFDDRDPLCPHAVVYEQEAAVATGRIDLDKGGKVGRVAVLKSHRRRGVGRLLMQALEQHARQQGAERVWCHAQLQAVPFYELLGYRVCGDEFEEANIPHVFMEKTLQNL